MNFLRSSSMTVSPGRPECRPPPYLARTAAAINLRPMPLGEAASPCASPNHAAQESGLLSEDGGIDLSRLEDRAVDADALHRGSRRRLDAHGAARAAADAARHVLLERELARQIELAGEDC